MKLPKYYALKVFLRSGQVLEFKCKVWEFIVDQDSGTYTKFRISGTKNSIKTGILLKEIVAYTCEKRLDLFSNEPYI